MLPSDKKTHTLRDVIIISVAVIVANINVLANKFVFDDIYLVVHNPNIKSLGNIPVIFTTGYWSSVGPTGGLYRPLTMLSFLLEHSVAGLNPLHYHLDNLLLHLFCSVLAYLILRIILESDTTAFFAALIFAVHPVHTEPVAWVSGRAELLSAFLGFLSAYIFLAKPRKSLYTFLFSFTFFLSLLSKESSIVIPALLGIYLLLFAPPPDGSRLKYVVVRLYPYAVTFALYMIPRIYVLGTLGPTGREQTFGDVKPYYTFLTMCAAFTHYIRLAFLPFDLHVDYLFPPPFSFFEARVLFPLVLLAAIIIFSRRIINTSRPVFFSIIWFFMALLPVSNIIPVGIIMSERAMYIPSLGPCLLVGLAIVKGGDLINKKTGGKAIYGVILIPILIFFAILSFHRNPAWHDQTSFELDQIGMIRHRIELFPDYSPYYTMLANMYIEKGDVGSTPENLIKEALRLDNSLGYAYAHYELAKLYLRRSVPEMALEEAMLSIKLEPSNSDAYNIAGAALHMLGRDVESAAMIEKAILINPGIGEYYLNRGLLKNPAGDTEGALANFNKATDLDPLLFDAYLQAGIIYGARNEFKLAAEKLKMATELKPDNADAHYLLAIAYSGTGMSELARLELEATVRLDPTNADARLRLQKQAY